MMTDAEIHALWLEHVPAGTMHFPSADSIVSFARALLSADAMQVFVQACRPEDRAMLNTPAGRELLTKATEAMKRCAATSPHPNMQKQQCGLPDGHDGDHTVLIPTGAPWDPSR